MQALRAGLGQNLFGNVFCVVSVGRDALAQRKKRCLLIWGKLDYFHMHVHLTKSIASNNLSWNLVEVRDSPAHDIWSVHAVLHRSYQMGRVVWTSPLPRQLVSPGGYGLQYAPTLLIQQRKNSGPNGLGP